MIEICAKTGFDIETITSGFLGHKVSYCLWLKNKFVAHSLDKKTWKLGTWINSKPLDLNTIKAIIEL